MTDNIIHDPDSPVQVVSPRRDHTQSIDRRHAVSFNLGAAKVEVRLNKDNELEVTRVYGGGQLVVAPVATNLLVVKVLES